MKINLKHTTTTIILLLLNLGATHIANAQTPTWQWGKRGGSPGSVLGNEDNVVDMATDQHGNVYVLGENKTGTISNVDGHQGIGIYDCASIASWDCNGNFRWKKTYGGGALWLVHSLKVDTLGGVYVMGTIANTNSLGGPGYFDVDTVLPYTFKVMFLIKYDTSGNYQWLNMPEPDTVTTSSNAYNQFVDMDVTPSGDIYALCNLSPGTYNGGNYIVTQQSVNVLQYNKDGTFISGTKMDIATSGGPGMGGNLYNIQTSHFIRDHRNGRYYLSDYYDPDFGTLSFGPTLLPVDTAKFYLAAFDSTGNSLWTKTNSGNGISGIQCRQALDNQGNIYIAGYALPGDNFNGYNFANSTQPMPFVIKVDSNGNNVWGTHAITTYSVITGAVCYSNNTIVAVGGGGQFHWDSNQVVTPPGLNYIFLTRINAITGNVIAIDTIPSNSLYSYASSIVSDKNNNFYVGGWFGNQLYPANDTLTNTGGMYDWFVAKFGSANCNCTIPQPSYSYTNSGDNYNFTYTGSTPYTNISWDFGDGSPLSTTANPIHGYTASGNYNVCVTVTNACGENVSCQQINTDGNGINDIAAYANIRIYPNPATQEIIIDNASAGTILDIYNTTGQLVLHTTLKGAKDKIAVSQLASGLYLMRFIDKEGRHGNYKFVKQG